MPLKECNVRVWYRRRLWCEAQRAYDRAQASHNPNNLIALLHHYPWHVDALLAGGKGVSARSLVHPLDLKYLF